MAGTSATRAARLSGSLVILLVATLIGKSGSVELDADLVATPTVERRCTREATSDVQVLDAGCAWADDELTR